jgi:8-oxo-dGTP pyrophosphatase MutT (NUDIX family)
MELPTKQLAGCVIYDDKGGILLIHRNTLSLVQWELPGGKVEKDESLEQTAIRETQEEIGVVVNVVDILGSANFIHEHINWNYTWFEARIGPNDVPVVKEPEKFDKINYFPIYELRKRSDLSPNVTNLLKALK